MKHPPHQAGTLHAGTNVPLGSPVSALQSVVLWQPTAFMRFTVGTSWSLRHTSSWCGWFSVAWSCLQFKYFVVIFVFGDVTIKQTEVHSRLLFRMRAIDLFPKPSRCLAQRFVSYGSRDLLPPFIPGQCQDPSPAPPHLSRVLLAAVLLGRLKHLLQHEETRGIVRKPGGRGYQTIGGQAQVCPRWV